MTRPPFRPRLWGQSLLALLLLALTLAAPARAQWPTATADPVDNYLQVQDSQVKARFSQFPADPRYEEVLHRIGTKVNAHLHEVFPNSEEEVTYGVFLSDLGFNGVAWHRVIILDSLLLDGLRRLAESIAVSGRLENEYADQLAAYIGRLGSTNSYGAPLRNLAMVDPGNPYNLPAPPGLTFEASRKADAIFEDILAAWVCHELSHCYLGHSREKIETQLRLQNQYAGQMNPFMLNQQIQQYVNYQMAPAKELEADRAGARLAARCGWSLDGFRYWYGFIDRIEQHTGAAYSTVRTHPPGSQRFQAVKEVYTRER